MNNEIKILEISSKEYPPLLKEIDKPPSKLYCLGDNFFNSLFPLAIVGSRMPSAYAKSVLEIIISPKVISHCVIVSGLALGVDTLAHKISERTIAVLGGGLDNDNFYPQENWPLGQKIVAGGGTIISEFPPGTPPRSKNFPQRNRIIAGLSQAVLVIQAKKRSGAMITARLALENGRDVLAVPGPINEELSAGPNLLISQGAIPITCASDLEEYLKIA